MIGCSTISSVRSTSLLACHPQPKQVDGLTQIEWTAGHLESIVDHVGNEPVVLAAVDLLLGERRPVQTGFLQVKLQEPPWVVERLNRYAVPVLPLPIALRGVPRLKPRQRVRLVHVELRILSGHPIMMPGAGRAPYPLIGRDARPRWQAAATARDSRSTAAAIGPRQIRIAVTLRQSGSPFVNGLPRRLPAASR